MSPATDFPIVSLLVLGCVTLTAGAAQSLAATFRTQPPLTPSESTNS